jgi:hypothetical protein
VSTRGLSAKENIATKKHAAILRPQQTSPLTLAEYSTIRRIAECGFRIADWKNDCGQRGSHPQLIRNPKSAFRIR